MQRRRAHWLPAVLLVTDRARTIMTDNLTQHRVDAVSDGACDEWRYHTRPKRLPLSVEMRPGETATSLCSRDSVANGLPRMRTKCTDFLIGHVDLCNGETNAVIRVAELAGVDPDRLQFHTPRLIEPSWFLLGHEKIKSPAMLRNGGQLCPLCIAEDECRDPLYGPYQRDTWQVAAFRRCRKHDVAFERPQFDCRHSEVHDFLQVLKTWSPAAIMHIGSDVTALEDYLLQRIRQGRGSDWIDRQAFHVVWVVSETLGLLLTEGPKAKLHEQDAGTLIRAGAAGFDVLRAGPNRIRAVLTAIRDDAGADQSNYGKLYAPVLTCLLERRRDPGFDEIRRLVRSFILQNFRVPPNSSVLGEKSVGNHVFTALTASRHFDVPLSVLNRQLRKEGLRSDPRHNEKSDPTLLVPRDRMEAVIAEVRKLSSIAVTRAVIGADRYVMDRLCAAGLLVPHFPDDGCMPMFHHDEVMRFLKRMKDAATTVRKPSRYWRPVTSAAARTHCSTAWIISQVFDGKLELAARLPDPFQLADFLVPMNPLKALLQARPEGMVTAAEAAKWLGADIRTVHALAIYGYLPSQMAENRLANRPQRLIPMADLEVFAHRYVVMRALNGQRKALYTDTLAFIADHGLSPILMREGTKPVFERQPLERIACLDGGEQLAWLLSIENSRLETLSGPTSKPGSGDAEEGAA